MRPRLVLDASAAVHILCGLPAAPRLVEELSNTSLVLAPELYVAEVGNAIWKYVSSGDLERDDASRLFFESRTLVDVTVPHHELADEAFAAAIRNGHPVYDLLYAILARRNAAAVLTMDRRLAGLLGRMDVEVVEVAE